MEEKGHSLVVSLTWFWVKSWILKSRLARLGKAQAVIEWHLNFDETGFASNSVKT